MIAQHKLDFFQFDQSAYQTKSQRQIIQQIERLSHDLLRVSPKLQIRDSGSKKEINQKFPDLIPRISHFSADDAQQQHRFITVAHEFRQSLVNFQFLHVLINVNFPDLFQKAHDGQFQFFAAALCQSRVC